MKGKQTRLTLAMALGLLSVTVLAVLALTQPWSVPAWNYEVTIFGHHFETRLIGYRSGLAEWNPGDGNRWLVIRVEIKKPHGIPLDLDSNDYVVNYQKPGKEGIDYRSRCRTLRLVESATDSGGLWPFPPEASIPVGTVIRSEKGLQGRVYVDLAFIVPNDAEHFNLGVVRQVGYIHGIGQNSPSRASAKPGMGT